MLVAAIMVLSIAAVMFVGAENEPPGTRLPENYQLQYSVSVEYENRTVNGTQTHNQTGSTGWGYSDWDEENYTGPGFWDGFSGGYMIEEVELNTSWGTKYVQKCVGVGLGTIPDFILLYLSSDSSILYKKVIVNPEYRATFVLTGVNFTEIMDMDLQPSGREPFPGYPDYDPDYHNHWDFLGGANDAMAQVEPGHDWYRLNCTNYAYLYFSQENVLSMIDGGDYVYDQERSLIGNGTLHFQATGDWYLRHIYPLSWENSRFIMDGALTAEE